MRYYFNITIVGSGDSPDEAWRDAYESFSEEPGPTPEDDEYTMEDEDE